MYYKRQLLEVPIKYTCALGQLSGGLKRDNVTKQGLLKLATLEYSLFNANVL